MAQHETIEELKKFTGCETIIGNLILMNIKDPDGTKLEFFSSVKKITGYLAVIQCELPYLPFPNLQIISGQNLIPQQKKPKFALFVSHVNNTLYAGLNNLREISNGHVLIRDNSNNLTGYSDANNILWDDIMMNDGTATITPIDTTDFYLSDHKCHPNCKHPGRCWGPALESCQDMSMQVCQDQCYGGRCYFAEDSPQDPICCHKDCSGGCTGMTNADCFGCRNLNAEGQCVPNCPPPTIYDISQFRMVDNPNALYRLFNECLKECPTSFLVEEGGCVKKCSDHLMTEHHTNKCVPCPPEGCPKR
jgi:receptor tyrosine-protein kinase erbB-4